MAGRGVGVRGARQVGEHAVRLRDESGPLKALHFGQHLGCLRREPLARARPGTHLALR